MILKAILQERARTWNRIFFLLAFSCKKYVARAPGRTQLSPVSSFDSEPRLDTLELEWIQCQLCLDELLVAVAPLPRCEQAPGCCLVAVWCRMALQGSMSGCLASSAGSHGQSI